jgi:hypothetical protein
LILALGGDDRFDAPRGWPRRFNDEKSQRCVQAFEMCRPTVVVLFEGEDVPDLAGADQREC